jgi:hypothetical protein
MLAASGFPRSSFSFVIDLAAQVRYATFGAASRISIVKSHTDYSPAYRRAVEMSVNMLDLPIQFCLRIFSSTPISLLRRLWR